MACQAAHASIDFIFQHFDRAGPWHEDSNYLVFLKIDNENKLKELAEKCKEKYLKITEFYEPDLDNSLTAIAIEPSELTQKLTKNLNLL